MTFKRKRDVRCWLKPVALLVLATFPLVGNSQNFSVNVSLSGADELVVQALEPLEFGGLLVDSGIEQVIGTDPRAGAFSITGASKRNITVTLPPGPIALISENNDELIYTRKAAYRNDGVLNNDPAGATEFVGNSATFRVLSTRGGPSVQETAFVWIYGDIDVLNIPAGNYTATFTLTAEYAMGGGGGPP